MRVGRQVVNCLLSDGFDLIHDVNVEENVLFSSVFYGKNLFPIPIKLCTVLASLS